MHSNVPSQLCPRHSHLQWTGPYLEKPRMKLWVVLMFVQEAEMKEGLTKSRLRLLVLEQAVKLVVLLAKVTQSTKSLFRLDFRGSSRYKLLANF